MSSQLTIYDALVSFALTEGSSRKVGPVLTAPGAEARSPESPQEASEPPYVRVGPSVASAHSSLILQLSIGSIARRYVARRLRYPLLTTRVAPSKPSQYCLLATATSCWLAWGEGKRQTFASLNETSNLSNPSTLDSIVRRAARPVTVPCS